MKINEIYSKLSDEQIIELIGELASLFHQALPIENTITITDREKFTHYIKGEEAVESNIELIGKPFPQQGSNIPIVLKTGQQHGGLIPKEVYGWAFKSSTVPIKNFNGDIIGTLTLVLSLKNQDALKEATESISSSADQLTAATEEIANSASTLLNNVTEVLNQTQEIIKLIDQTNNILDFVNNVASNSKLLGLNAAIEAARAGDFGKGFSVVAVEIRKMADNSAKSVNDTKKLISSINDKVNHLLNKTQELSGIAQTQAAATEEIFASIQELSINTKTAQKISDII
ncbi:MAG: methyl-accepting chemotaxis protein [Bacillota bacterium]